ncbi:hypothetical protein JMJ35_003626 [Cladonia borealis]|uniref:Fungal N-terminal domain-containing protein n=1 Tax=Cladonia borealis TaxID=184061 RepID=A0AA39R5A8_9LECA|nr:hypothetical protein JMJ35_003626 [Cladonia borealis]
MEVISAVSGIAGILNLLGQTIQSTQKLKGFFTDVTSASESVKLLLSDIDFLLTTSHHVSNLVDALPPEFEDSQIVTLRSKLESYSEDSSRWIKTAGKLRPASDIGARMWFKKFRVAVNMKSVTDLRNVLDTHKQNINLSLNLLGRALELSTAAGVGQLDRKVTAGTAASLSKIEEQNDLLEIIESYSRSSMQTSAASVKSLQSIATSLSRIEALASTVSVSAYDTADESGDADLKNYTRAKSIRRTRTRSVDTRDIRGKYRSHARRRSDGDVDPRGRRLSTGSYDSGRSSTSVKSLPAVPVIPAVYQLTKNDSKPFDEGLSGSRWKTVTRTQSESHQNSNEGAGSQQADDRSSGFPSPQGNADKYLEADARIQDGCWSRLLQHLAKQHGPLVPHYISLKRSIDIYECQLRLFSLVNQGFDTSVA